MLFLCSNRSSRAAGLLSQLATGNDGRGATSRIDLDPHVGLQVLGLFLFLLLYATLSNRFGYHGRICPRSPLRCSQDARGDQCDGCGNLLNPTELIKPRCKLTGTTPVLRSTRHVFLDLPQLSPVLQVGTIGRETGQRDQPLPEEHMKHGGWLS